MKKIIGLTYDLKSDYSFREGDPEDAAAELDKPQTVDLIAESLEAFGYHVIRIGNFKNLLNSLDKINVDIIFNICEGFYGRNRESQVPMLLEWANIPYVGADALTLGLALDKVLAKKAFITDGILTPKYFTLKDKSELDNFADLEFPLIVKPRSEGSSKGLSQKSKVNNYQELKERIDYVAKFYPDGVLIEEFIKGAEFTVAVIGNKPNEKTYNVQTKIDGKLDLGETFYTFGHVTSDRIEYLYPSPISKDLEKIIEDAAIRAYRAVDCRDFGRVDIRVDEKNRAYVLEINPLPSLSIEDAFPLIAKGLGLEYKDLINQILNEALIRYSLNKDITYEAQRA